VINIKLNPNACPHFMVVLPALVPSIDRKKVSPKYQYALGPGTSQSIVIGNSKTEYVLFYRTEASPGARQYSWPTCARTWQSYRKRAREEV
jgi:hypothetical protein